MALSALGSAAEWIGCLIVPALVCVLIATGIPAVRITAACFAAICLMQAVLTEIWLGTASQFGVRLTRVALLPLACMVHGAGGVLGCFQLLGGGSGAGKTERGPEP